MKFRERTSAVKLLNRAWDSKWVPSAMIAIANLMLAISALSGSEWAVIAIALFGGVVAVLLALNQRLVRNLLDTSQVSLEGWKLESEYAERVSGDYLKMLSRLYELDPVAAEVFQDRLAEALTSRHPEIAIAAHERARNAEMN